MFPNKVRMERDAPSPEPMVYLFIYIRRSPRLRSRSTKTGKTYGHRPRSPMRTESLHTMGCGLVPRPLLDSTQHSQERDIHSPGEIRIHNPRKRAAADPPIRPCSHWDPQK